MYVSVQKVTVSVGALRRYVPQGGRLDVPLLYALIVLGCRGLTMGFSKQMILRYAIIRKGNHCASLTSGICVDLPQDTSLIICYSAGRDDWHTQSLAKELRSSREDDPPSTVDVRVQRDYAHMRVTREIGDLIPDLQRPSACSADLHLAA